jgi:hypothetical protein
VVVDRKVSVGSDAHVLNLGLAQGGIPAAGEAQSTEVFRPSAGSLEQAQAITYEKSGAGSIIRFLLALAIVALLIYFLLHRS